MMQAKVDNFVLQGVSLGYNEEQLIGMAMLAFTLFYDDAKRYVARALSNIHEEVTEGSILTA